MIKIFETKTPPIEKGTYVLVNPFSGKIYAFQEAVGDPTLAVTDSTTVVAVEVSPEVFKTEFDNGLFYRDKAFYRGWPTTNPRVIVAKPKDSISFMAPQNIDGKAQITIHKNSDVVWYTIEDIKNGVLTFFMPELENGSYTLRVTNNDYGTHTAILQIVHVFEPNIEKPEEFSVMKNQMELLNALREASDPNTAAELLIKNMSESAEEYLNLADETGRAKKIFEKETKQKELPKLKEFFARILRHLPFK